MLWIVLIAWLVALAAAAWIFFVLGRSLYRKARVLAAELTDVAERFSAIGDGLQEIGRRSAPQPSVFADPVTVRQEQRAARKQALRARSKSPTRRMSKRRHARSVARAGGDRAAPRSRGVQRAR